MIVVMTMLWRGLFGCALEITTHIQNLLALISPAVLAGGVRHKRDLAGGAQADVLGFHRIVRATASNAGS